MCLAIPGRIKTMESDGRFATVDVMGVRRRVNVELLADEAIAVGDWVLIHVGFAMSRIGEEEAEEQLRLLAAFGEQDDALDEWRGYTLGGGEP